MKAIETAREIVETLGTRDALAIAEQSGVKIVYGDWHPVTLGEFDRQKRTICVNLRAVTENIASKESIVAHELGHFFAAPFDLDRRTEEAFAAEFADELLK